jgi:large subunit ribosomal protein L23
MALNIFKKEEDQAVQQKAPKMEEKSKDSKNPKLKKSDFSWKTLKTAHVTEKATDLTAQNKYVFNVYPGTNKSEIKKSVESTYGVKVISVNIINIPGKKRTVGRKTGYKPGYKKAVVGIKEGQKIELMPR